MAKKVIIAVHGLRNKPPRGILKRWWKVAILEGLERLGQPSKEFEFELVYWAHMVNSEPLDITVADQNHPLYVEDPYVPADGQADRRAPSRYRKKALDLLEGIMDRLFLAEHRFFNFDFMAERVIRKQFHTLRIYYDRHNNTDAKSPGLRARERIRESLSRVLRKHRRKSIMLIAHSMGSIIAYDVLTQMAPNLRIDTFVTLGSPLGIPIVLKQSSFEQHYDLSKEGQAPTPENITGAWLNFADLNDRIAINYDLADDYGKNSRGIGPTDIVVRNDYIYKNRRNHHCVYGYLRTREVAQTIHNFLRHEKPGLLGRIKTWFGKNSPRADKS